jgi:hypothetical protein
MTTQNTPTNKPTNSSAQPKSRGTWTAAPRARDEQRSSSPRPASSWLVSVGIAAALVAATWLAVTGVIDEYELAPSARADQTSSASQQELADHEVQQFNNRAEAHRRHRANQQREQQLTDPSADHEVQQFNNRAEAHRRHRANQQREQQLTTNPSDSGSRL